MIEQYSEAQILSMLNQCLEEGCFQDINQILNLCFNQENNLSEEFVNSVKILQNAIKYRAEVIALQQAQLTKTEYERVSGLYDPPTFFHQSRPRRDMNITSDDIWWCWFQGLEQAPKIVKACYDTVLRLGRRVHVITADNYSDYITMPEHVIEKWKQGVISYANFSDMLRLELLTTYGGTWIDSTIYLTSSNMMELIKKQDLFLYQHIFCGIDSDFVNSASWLMHSNGNSNILSDAKNMMYQYWINEQQLNHYLLVCICLTLACNRHPQEWAKVPVYSDVPPHVLQSEITHVYSEDRWNQICKMTDIHKLTYKIQRPETDDYLFYDYILRH